MVLTVVPVPVGGGALVMCVLAVPAPEPWPAQAPPREGAAGVNVPGGRCVQDARDVSGPARDTLITRAGSPGRRRQQAARGGYPRVDDRVELLGERSAAAARCGAARPR